MELRQVRFFVTLAEELHFGRAAAREHIVQSALSQHIRRLEGELGVRLFLRDTHHVELTPAGAAFLVHARQMLAGARQAAQAARQASASAPALRAGVGDASCDSMARVLRDVQEHWPELEIHQVEAGVPTQLRMLAEGQLDVGFGRASLAPPQIASALVRLDPLGVLLPGRHRLARLSGVPVSALAGETLLLPHEERAPEFGEFVIELCRTAGFTPTLHRGTVDSVLASADLAAQGRCVPCVPESCRTALGDAVWKPLTEPPAGYPLSVMWRDGDSRAQVRAVITSARSLAAGLGWLDGLGRLASAHRLPDRNGNRQAS